MTRGNKCVSRKGSYTRRARLFADRIRDDLNIETGSPADASAIVYVTARDWVHAREVPKAGA